MKNVRVVIAADTDDVAGDLAKSVRTAGGHVAGAVTGGRQALECAEKERPDVMLVALGLHGEPGAAGVSRTIRERFDIPTVYVCGPGEDTLPLPVPEGADADYIVLPASAHQLRVVTSAVVLRERTRKHLAAQEAEYRKLKTHLEAVISGKTAELRKANIHLRRLLHDIEQTERRLATDALESGEGDGTGRITPGEGVITADNGLRVVIINAAASQLLGWADEEAPGKPVREVIACTANGAERLNAAISQVTTGGSRQETIRNLEIRSRDGTLRIVTIIAEPVLDSDDSCAGFVLMFSESGQEPAGSPEPAAADIRGIAHDLNNTLSSLLANIQLVRTDVEVDSLDIERLNRAEESVQRARNLTQQLFLCTGGRSAGGVPQSETAPVKPAAAPAHDLPLSPASTPRAQQVTKKRILLLDDEEAILAATSEMLKFLGYHVSVARDGSEAIRQFREDLESGTPFDAVILDITIPDGMGAGEILPELVRLDSTVRAIVSSGYSTNPMITDYAGHGFVAAIVKPYGFRELGEALDLALKK